MRSGARLATASFLERVEPERGRDAGARWNASMMPRGVRPWRFETGPRRDDLHRPSGLGFTLVGLTDLEAERFDAFLGPAAIVFPTPSTVAIAVTLTVSS